MKKDRFLFFFVVVFFSVLKIDKLIAMKQKKQQQSSFYQVGSLLEPESTGFLNRTKITNRIAKTNIGLTSLFLVVFYRSLFHFCVLCVWWMFAVAKFACFSIQMPFHCHPLNWFEFSSFLDLFILFLFCCCWYNMC